MRNMTTALALTMLSGAAMASSSHYVGQELAPSAKVTMAAAKAIALRAHPGKMTDAELERRAAVLGCATRSTLSRGARPSKLGSTR